MTAKQFPICDALYENPAKHCASLVVTEEFVTSSQGKPQLPQPSNTLRNGTITFVETSGRVYGITCWHVVDHFRKQILLSGNPHSHAMRTMVGGFYYVLDRFIRPKPPLGMPDLDVALRELDPEFPGAIGKTPINLDAVAEPPPSIAHGLAVGFPETMKYKKTEDSLGYRVSMPQVEIVAELEWGMPTQRFTMFSELPDAPKQSDFSGMSGGPIFWSDENSYGIFGVIYEGGTGLAFSEGKAVYVYGELATPKEIKEWIAQVQPHA